MQPEPLLPPAESYDEMVRRFRWNVPARFNIADVCCDRWAAATPEAPALLLDRGARAVSFRELQREANRLANELVAHGLDRGDRVAILLPQALETAVAHLAVQKVGAIAIPLFTLFGPEALQFRLTDSGTKLLITEAAQLEKLWEVRPSCPELETIIVVGLTGEATGLVSYDRALAAASDDFRTADTAADDPALIVYTSGTTGPPKGALHAGRVLLGHLPGTEFPHERFPQPGDRFWTPADWAWVGGLLDVLMPALYHGVPVVVHRAGKFDPVEAFDLIRRAGVRNSFMPPTALKMMRQVRGMEGRMTGTLRSIASGGETVGAELLDWGHAVFGLTINELYGQTECNLVVAGMASLMDVRPGSMGRAVPGHQVAVVDDDGNPLPDGTAGNLAVRRGDPVMFLGYWNQPDATAQKYAGEWLLTGDTGQRDADGYFWFGGRADDVISTSGYRVGPGEIEDCLLKHPAVAMVGVVGVPDEVRGEAIKAFVVPADGHAPSPDLAAEIQAFVKERLAAHEYPRQVQFMDALPLTATGKIMRRELRKLG